MSDEKLYQVEWVYGRSVETTEPLTKKDAEDIYSQMEDNEPDYGPYMRKWDGEEFRTIPNYKLPEEKE